MTKVPFVALVALAWLTILALGIAGVYGKDSPTDWFMLGVFVGGFVGFGACAISFAGKLSR